MSGCRDGNPVGNKNRTARLCKMPNFGCLPEKGGKTK